MSQAMRFGADELIAGATICSGIGAPEQAMPWVNWKWCAEIERFPSAVLAQRHPQTVNLGDVTAKDFIVRALKFGPIDVLVAGTPCQDLSVAGKRAGLAGGRSGLFFRLMEVVDAIKPAWILFENVPGLLSSNDGADFIAVLDHFEGARYVIDVDVLDAQYFRLAQRRERVFIVCEHVDHLLTSRTPSSGLTIAQCLLEISALVLAAAEIPSNRDSSEWDFNATNVKDSVLRRIKLFSLEDTAQASILAENLVAIPMLSGFAAEDSGLPHGSGRTGTATDTRSRKSGRATETIAGFQNTGRLLKKQLEESLLMLSVFATSTSESEITESTIYTFSQLTLSITRLIVQSDCLSPSFWSAASSCSTALKGYINYARAATSSLFTELGWLQPWADFLREALPANDLIVSLRERADSSEVLPVSKGLRRNTEASREAREGITHPVAPSLTGSGRGVERGGDSRGQDPVIAMCLNGGGQRRIDGESETFITAPLTQNPYGDNESRESLLIAHSLRADGFDASEDGTGRGTPLVAVSGVCEVGIYHCGDCGEEYAALGSTDPSLPRVQLDGFMPLANSCPNCGGHGDTVSYPAGSFGAHAERSGIADSLRSHPRPGSNSLGAVTVTPILEAGARTGKSTTDKRTGSGIGESGDPMYTLQSGKQHAVAVHGTQDPCVSDIAFALGRNDGQENAIAFSSKDHGADAGELSPTLRSIGHDGHANGGGQVAACFDTTQVTSKANRSNPKEGDPSHPLASGAHAPAVAINLRGRDGGAMPESSDVASLRSASGGSSRSYVQQMAVRRLTPTECERLQGFSDDYTLVPHRGKPAVDGPRYKALGNSMAVPCIAWIGNRIRTQLQKRNLQMNDRDTLLLDIFKAMREEYIYDRRNRLYVLAEAMLTEPEEQTVEEIRADLVALLGAVR